MRALVLWAVILSALATVAALGWRWGKCETHGMRARTPAEYMFCMSGCKYSCGECRKTIYYCKDKK